MVGARLSKGILLTVKTEFPSVLTQGSSDLDGKCHKVLKQTLVLGFFFFFFFTVLVSSPFPLSEELVHCGLIWNIP